MGSFRAYSGGFVFALALLMGHQAYGHGLTLNPGLLFALIFHISLHNSLRFFPLFLFTSGFYLDFLWGYPLGLMGGLFLLTYGAVLLLRQSLNHKPFWMIWGAYGGVSFLLWFFEGLILWKAGGGVSFSPPFGLSFLWSWAFYPFLSVLLTGLSRGRMRHGK